VNAGATLGRTSNQEGNKEGQVGGDLLGLPDASCAPEGEGCAPCVAQLAVPADRMAAMLAAGADAICSKRDFATIGHVLASVGCTPDGRDLTNDTEASR